MTRLIPPPVHAVHSRPTPRRFSKLWETLVQLPPSDEESAAHVLAAGLQNNYSLSVKKKTKKNERSHRNPQGILTGSSLNTHL